MGEGGWRDIAFCAADPLHPTYTHGSTASPVGRIHTRSAAAYGPPILVADGYAPPAGHSYSAASLVTCSAIH